MRISLMGLKKEENDSNFLFFLNCTFLWLSRASNDKSLHIYQFCQSLSGLTSVESDIRVNFSM